MVKKKHAVEIAVARLGAEASHFEFLKASMDHHPPRWWVYFRDRRNDRVSILVVNAKTSECHSVDIFYND